MPKVEITKSYYTTNNADFQAWCQALEAAILAVGLVQVPQTGEANLATITRPTALGQLIGWRCYAFNDALQATAPVYIKVFFGSSQSAPSALTSGNSYGLFNTFWFVCTGLDGSGNIVGKTSYTRALSYNCDASCSTNTIASADQANSHLVSGDINRFAIIMGQNSDHNANIDCYGGGVTAENTANNIAAKTSFFLVERTKDTNGDDTDEGIIIMSMGHPTPNGGYNLKWHYSKFIPTYRVNSYDQFFINCCYPGDTNRNTTLNGLQISAFPFYPMEGGKIHNPPIGIIGGLPNDFVWAGATPSTVKIYDQDRQYRIISAKMPVVVGRLYTSSKLMILWED